MLSNWMSDYRTWTDKLMKIDNNIEIVSTRSQQQQQQQQQQTTPMKCDALPRAEAKDREKQQDRTTTKKTGSMQTRRREEKVCRPQQTARDWLPRPLRCARANVLHDTYHTVAHLFTFSFLELTPKQNKNLMQRNSIRGILRRYSTRG